MLTAFFKNRTARIALMLAIVGGFSGGCIFEDHDRDHHHHHEWHDHD